MIEEHVAIRPLPNEIGILAFLRHQNHHKLSVVVATSLEICITIIRTNGITSIRGMKIGIMCKLQHITIITGQDGNMGPIWSHLILICYIVLLVNIIMLLAFLVYINLEDTAIMWGKIYISPYVFLKFGHFHTALICLLFTNKFEANMLPKSTLDFPTLEYLNSFINLNKDTCLIYGY